MIRAFHRDPAAADPDRGNADQGQEALVLGDLTQDVKVPLSTRDVADLAEEASHVTVLHGGRILHDDTAYAFMCLTPPGIAPGRAAEGAYTALLEDRGLDY
ncbi:hypothetical protein ACFXKK_23350 [Streptomyces globisporus]|uniref:hypothetical protein n=1 Tax=Streptomyces globisporus TaxID=1908 RepID=UPI003661F5C2